MYYYFVTRNAYYGYCVSVYDGDSGISKIVFTGSIEECNRKCIELNKSR